MWTLNNIISIPVVKCSTSCFRVIFLCSFSDAHSLASGKFHWKIVPKSLATITRIFLRSAVSLSGVLATEGRLSCYHAWLTEITSLAHISRASTIDGAWRNEEIMNLAYVSSWGNLERARKFYCTLSASFYVSRHSFVLPPLFLSPAFAAKELHNFQMNRTIFLHAALSFSFRRMSLLNGGGFLSLHILWETFTSDTIHRAMRRMKIMKRLFSPPSRLDSRMGAGKAFFFLPSRRI